MESQALYMKVSKVWQSQPTVSITPSIAVRALPYGAQKVLLYYPSKDDVPPPFFFPVRLSPADISHHVALCTVYTLI